MEPAELEIAIDELETKVERLRALYEQYFMGIERIPPAVVQKDVERRVYILRREQIRNTARRFKLQTIIQRYNTFQQYWMRILREIENGTYRRHVLRAEKTVGVAGLLTAAERKRLGLPEPETKLDPGDASTAPDEPTTIPPDIAPETVRSPSSLAPPLPPSPAQIRSQIERDLGLLLDENDELSALKKIDLGRELDDPLLSSLPPAPRKKKPSLRAPRRPTDAPSSRRSSRAGRSSDAPDSVRTAHGLGPVSPRSKDAVPPTSRKSIRPDRIVTIEPPRGPLSEIAVQPRAQTATPARGLRMPAQSAVAGRGLPPPPKPSAESRGAPLPPPASRIAPAPASAEAPKAQPSPIPVPRKPQVETSTNHQKPDSAPRGLPSIRDSVIPRSNRSAPPPVRPARPPAVTPSPPIESKTVATPTMALDRARVEQLAEKLRAARKQTLEPSPVSVDALAKKLDATATELQKKHAGKRIDFDVVIKDGKAIVKPIVR